MTRCATRSWRRTCAPTQKELAEHAMLVDLARNDVGRVAEPGSVEWPLLYGVERYSHVMHLVSEVRGRLRERPGRVRRGPGDLPGGHPLAVRRRCARCRPSRRWSRPGEAPTAAPWATSRPTTLEIAITIRSVVLRDGTAFVHAGAGIVADSVPATESAEVAAKAGAVLAALAEAEATMAASAGEGTEA